MERRAGLVSAPTPPHVGGRHADLATRAAGAGHRRSDRRRQRRAHRRPLRAHGRGAALGIDNELLIATTLFMDRTTRGSGPPIRVAAAVHSVPINVGLSRSGNASYVNPAALLDWVLEKASHSEPTLRIENVETDSVRPLGCLGGVIAVVHAQHPLVLAGFSFPHPVNVTRTFPIRKVQDVRPQPRRDSEFAGCADTEVVARRNLDVIIDSVEAQIYVASVRCRTHESYFL